MAAAIDGNEPPAKKKFTFVRTSHEQKENDPPPKEAVSAAIIQAAGATFNNMTFNLQVTSNMSKWLVSSSDSLKKVVFIKEFLFLTVFLAK